MNIAGLNRAAVLAALYNRARPMGAGFIHYDPKPMTVEQAQKILDQTTDFDYLAGRVMKVDLSEDEIYTGMYNRDNGPEAAEKVIEELRKSGDANAQSIRTAHDDGTMRAAREAEKMMGVIPGPGSTVGGLATFQMGLSDLREHIQPKIDTLRKDRN